MAELEDFDDIDDIDEPVVDGEIVSGTDPEKLKKIARTLLIVGGLYLLNPLFGVDLLPDNLPLIGNIDEVLAMFLVLGSMRYLGINLPLFLERWMESPLGLPAPTKSGQEQESTGAGFVDRVQ